MFLRQLTVGAILIACAAVPFQLAVAQSDYPNRQIRLIVPVGAGGATDALARAVSRNLGDVLGQTIVVENKPGAASNVGAEAAAKANPDGYTLLFGHIGIFSLNPVLYKKLNFDPAKDFVAISPTAETAYVLITSPKLPVDNVRDLVEYARARPGQLNYASVGQGSVQHLAAELFKSMTKLELASIPYNSPPQMKVDLIEGRVHLIFDNVVAARPQIDAKSVKPLAVTSASRTSLMPTIPTLAESGYKGYRITSWFGFFAPAGVPREVIAKVSAACAKIMKQPELLERFKSLGAEPMYGTSEEFTKFIAEENVKWANLVRQAGVPPQ